MLNQARFVISAILMERETDNILGKKSQGFICQLRCSSLYHELEDWQISDEQQAEFDCSHVLRFVTESLKFLVRILCLIYIVNLHFTFLYIIS